MNALIRDFRNTCQGTIVRVRGARFAGFGGLENGELLDAAEAAKFDVLLTVDRGIEYQQALAHRKIAIIIFRTKSIRLKDLVAYAPDCLAHLESIQPGQVIRIGE
jgi:hypothetical protein